MGRIVFRPSLLFVVLVAAAAKDIPTSSSYVIRHTDSCPDVGYYFRREPAPNTIDPGPCLLCFCQDNGTAACWTRESKRCDVEENQYNDVVRETRVRRSPVSLSDIFFRDATRDFFDKNLPEECKPFEESFSDGCPPADWCIGCTICDCDANGRWDCHILSFCNDEEKKKIDGVKIPPPKSKRTGKKKGGYRPFKIPKTSTTKTTAKPKNKIARTKPVKKSTKPEKKVVKKEIRKVIRKVNKAENKTQNTNNMNSKRRKIIIKRKANNQKIKQKRENPEQTIKDIVIKKEIATHKPVVISNTIMKGYPTNISNNEYVLGQILVKRVMSSVQKLVKNELDKLNKTMERLQDGSDCDEIQRRKKKPPQEFKFKKIGEEFRWMRDKRDVSQKTATSHYENGIETTNDNYENGIETTTDNIDVLETLTKRPTSSKWINETTLLSVSLNISQKSNEIDFKEDFNSNKSIYEATPAVKNENIAVLHEMKEENKHVEIVVENHAAINKTNNLNTTKQIIQNVIIVPEFYNENLNKISTIQNYKYNIDNIPTEKSKIIATTSFTTNTPVKEKTIGNLYTQQTLKGLGVTKKYNLKKVIKKNFKELKHIYFPLNEVFNEKRPPKKLFLKRNKNMLKKNSTENLKRKFNFLKYIKKIFNKIFFGKKKKYLQQKDDEFQILRILCENIHACNINKKNQNVLKIKIRKINVEANSIFRTMKIIKGLLHFIDIPKQANTSNFKDDIKKLSVILKKSNGDSSKNMSETQKVQIEYIKRNTKIFTESVGRFTELLNDIIFILKKNKQEIQRPSKVADKNLTESFEKIRKLIIKHNLAENTFIKKLYNMLSEMENKVKSNKTQVSGQRTNINVIEDYSRNIIENLRKLKGLAQALNSNRNKREAMREDDTVKYLLLLMEYLIQKDQSVPVEPVNDGIDLLIDTIKSAPDIKSIKKKVLENFPSSADTISASSGNKGSILKDYTDLSSMSKETNVSTIDDQNNVYRAMSNEEDHYSIGKVNSISSTNYGFYGKVTEVPVTPEDKEEKTGFEKFESINAVSNKKHDTYVDDYDVYMTVANNSANNNANSETTPSAEPDYEYHDTTTVKIKENQSGDSIGNLEWIEENFGNEIREVRNHLKNTKESTITTTTTTTTSTKAPKNIVHNDISDVSQENNKKKKLSTEEVMYRKQMDLLNSLDYGTPKSDFDEAKSEEDDRFISETYF